MFFIIPTNEGQELNYVHNFQGLSLAEAFSFGRRMRDKLQDVLTQGSIGCIIQDEKAEEVALLASGEDSVWQSSKPKRKGRKS